MNEATETLELGVTSSLVTRHYPEGEGSYVAEVFWVAGLSDANEWHHFRRFDSAEEAEAFRAKVEGVLGAEVDAAALRPDCWASTPRKTLEERLRDERMWEVKDAIAEGYGADFSPGK